MHLHERHQVQIHTTKVKSLTQPLEGTVRACVCFNCAHW